jgi:hypothetical protein
MKQVVQLIHDGSTSRRLNLPKLLMRGRMRLAKTTSIFPKTTTALNFRGLQLSDLCSTEEICNQLQNLMLVHGVPVE